MYELHGLSRDEDTILGGFSDPEEDYATSTGIRGLNNKIHTFYSLTPEQANRAIEGLLKKGYMKGDDRVKGFRLSKFGVELWKVRSEEESRGMSVKTKWSHG